MGVKYICEEWKRIMCEKIHYRNRILDGGVTAPNYSIFYGKRVASPKNSQGIHDPVWALSLVEPWVNIENHNINGHGKKIFWRIGWGCILFHLLPSFTLNVYDGRSRSITLARWVVFRTLTPFTMMCYNIYMKFFYYCNLNLCLQIIQ